MRHISQSVIAAGCWLLSTTVMSATPVPQADGWVLDQAGVLSPDTESQLEVTLTEFAYSYNHEIAVLLVRGSAEEGLAAYGQRVLRLWELGGGEGRVALLLWSQEQGMTIQTGAASAALLDEEQQARILADTFGPAVVQNQIERGVIESLQRMMAVLGGWAESTPATLPPPPQAAEASRQEPEPQPELPPPDLPELADAEAAVYFPHGTWPQVLLVDTERILSGFNMHPGDTFALVFSEARLQAAALPDFLDQMVRELNGEPVAQPLGEFRLGLLGALGICLFIGALLLLGQKWIGAALILGLFAAPLLAVATGWAALGFAALMLAVVLPVFAKLLPIVLRALTQPGMGDTTTNDPRWTPRPHQSVSKPPLASSARPHSPVPTNRHASRPHQVVPPSAQTGSANPKALTAEDWQALKQALSAAGALPRLHAWHFIVLAVLFVTATPLAVLALLGYPAYYIYKLFTLDASTRERMLANPQVRERLNHLQRNNPELYQTLVRFQQTLNASKAHH